MKKHIGFFYLLFLVYLISPNVSGAQNTPQTHTIEIVNFGFTPSELQINHGDTVIFEWQQGATFHNVEQVDSSTDISYNGGFRSGDPQDGPATWEVPSSYTQENVTLFYICNPHITSHNMRGKIIVGAGSPGGDEGGANILGILAIFAATGLLGFAAIVVLQRRKIPPAN